MVILFSRPKKTPTATTKLWCNLGAREKKTLAAKFSPPRVVVAAAWSAVGYARGTGRGEGWRGTLGTKRGEGGPTDLLLFLRTALQRSGLHSGSSRQ